MEPSKNIVRGFEAFGRLLDDDPELSERVCFIACVYPSRESLPEYRAYARRVQDAVGQVNARYPDAIALHTDDDFDRSLGALTIYDVLLVNPIMDGMNLVSKEGPALNQRDGVLVLSRGAGSFGEMGEGAIVIHDPLDVAETATRIHEALEVTAGDRKARARHLRTRAEARLPGQWLEAQIRDLTSIRRVAAPEGSFEQAAQ